MICLEVTVNGSRLALAGAADAESVSVTLTLYPNLEEGWLDVTGVVAPGEQPLADARWLSSAVTAGDALQVRLIESAQPSAATLVRTDPDASATDEIPLVCAFCEKTPVESAGMVASRTAMICHDCIRYLNEMIATQADEP